MKFALIGQDIPMLLPTLLADLLFAGNEGADTAVYENNPAMQGVLQGYMDAIYQKRGLGGRALVSEDLPQVLEEAELLEIFQWSGADLECRDKLGRIREELADVLSYCVLMADVCGLDLDEILNAKVDQNAAKYPVEKARGSAAKYTELT